MKKFSLLFCLALFAFSLNFSACRSCKGGGWYGDRNLGYTPAKEVDKKQSEQISKPEEASCDITTP